MPTKYKISHSPAINGFNDSRSSALLRFRHRKVPEGESDREMKDDGVNGVKVEIEDGKDRRLSLLGLQRFDTVVGLQACYCEYTASTTQPWHHRSYSTLTSRTLSRSPLPQVGRTVWMIAG